MKELHRRELKTFRQSLLGWFRQYRRDLPWRKNSDPYRVWISEIMLQQTRVAAVIPYYERFLARFPDVCSLAEAPDEEVLRLWSGLGYYSRARNLQKAARQIVAERGGKFPGTRDELLTLPGIGEYTASAISSIAFGGRHAVLDGNVARVIARLTALRGELRAAGRWKQLQAHADQLVAADSAGDWNQAMMELGATVCAPRSPQCLLCPVAAFCQARKQGCTHAIPEKRRARGVVGVRLVSVVLVDGRNQTLLLPPPRTPAKSAAEDVSALTARLWHFPAAASAGDAKTSVARLLCRQFQLKASVARLAQPLQEVRHSVTYRVVLVMPSMLRVKRLPAISGARQVPIEAVTSLPISNLTRKIARVAIKNLRETARQS